MCRVRTGITTGLTALFLTGGLLVSDAAAFGRSHGGHRGHHHFRHFGGGGHGLTTGLAIGMGIGLVGSALARQPTIVSSPEEFVVRPPRRTKVGVIADDGKGGKAAPAPACAWLLLEIEVVKYGGATTPAEKAGVVAKLKDAALGLAQAIVDKVGTRSHQAILKAADNLTITKGKDVTLTYGCVDVNNKVLAAQIFQLDDGEAMNWWDQQKNKTEQGKIVNRYRQKAINNAKAAAQK